MLLQGMKFTTILLGALSLGMSFCHVLEMPPRRSWDASLWVATTVTGGLYYMYGPNGVGAWIDLGAILSAGVLAFLVRRRSGAFRWALVAAVSLLTAHAVWWARVFPANLELALWQAGPLPADWAQWRDRWEFGHAAVALCKLVGFAALTVSIIVETPPGGLPSLK